MLYPDDVRIPESGGKVLNRLETICKPSVNGEQKGEKIRGEAEVLAADGWICANGISRTCRRRS